ncbi:MAG: mechanosensitive ion channel family protein [Thermodesulfobacteriota bacterium]|nr:mechanosensitive ion channel family protein [Thermodesulfobacteriota bacterium]
MKTIQSLLSSLQWESYITSGLRLIFIIAFAWAITKFSEKLLEGYKKHLTRKSEEEGEPPSEYAKRIETIIRLLKQGIFLFIWITVSLIILKELGVEIGPIIATAGIIGLAIGFGAQNLVRDVLSGFFIILENQVRVGDVAIVNGTGGLVQEINFRTMVLRDLGGVVHIFPNGTVNTLSNLTKEWSAYVFEIGVAYKENTDSVIEIMKKVCESMKEDSKFANIILEEPEIFGVDKFDNSAVVIKGRIKTKPIRQWEVGREFLRRIKLEFDKNKIEIPFPHRTIYFGEESKPFNIQLFNRYQNTDFSRDELSDKKFDEKEEIE